MKKVSIIIPFLNEETNLSILYKEIVEVLRQIQYEIIFIDDGSTDGSYKEIRNLTMHVDNVTILQHARKQGKGIALSRGIKASKGDVILFMDADLQDNPADILAFLEKIEEGYDLVNGWRAVRHDHADKTLPSKIANTILWKGLLKTSLHDMNCGFKAFRKEVLEEFSFYGDNYRFIPFMAEQKGFKVAEVKVQHRSRVHGKSKYGMWRVFFGVIDTLTQYFIIRYSQKPFHFFGAFGTLITLVGFIIASVLTFQWYMYGEVLHNRPLLLFSMLLLIIGVQFFLTGILSELLVFLNNRYEKKY